MKSIKIGSDGFSNLSQQCRSVIDKVPFYIFVEPYFEDEESKLREKQIRVQYLSPFQDKIVFQTQSAPSPVLIQPSRVPDKNFFGPNLVLKTKYYCPKCQLGELVLNYEHKGDWKYDFCIYECCSPCIIICPILCNFSPKYRICTLCKNEFYSENA